MKVYVAAPWVRRPEAILFGQRLTALGHELTCRWFDHPALGSQPGDSSGSSSPDQLGIMRQALEDIEDVKRADVLIVLNLQKSEGKAVETGIALANRIPVISVGTRSNIFQSLGFEAVDEDAAIRFLTKMQCATGVEL